MRIALIKGDGIGVDVAEAAMAVTEAALARVGSAMMAFRADSTCCRHAVGMRVSQSWNVAKSTPPLARLAVRMPGSSFPLARSFKRSATAMSNFLEALVNRALRAIGRE